MNNIEMDMARSAIRMNKAVVEKLEGIDWEQRRYEIAREMLSSAAISVNSSQKDWMNGMTFPEASAVLAVRYADALTKELKKKV